MKVWGWSGFRNGKGTREVCYAKSKAAVTRFSGEKYPYQLWNLCETGNETEISLCIANPGVIFWKYQEDFNAPYVRD